METETLIEINKRTTSALSYEDAQIAHDEAERYNGWTNRETWATSLHLSNDETLYNMAREYAAEDEYGDALKEWIESLAQDVFDGADAAFGSAQTSTEVKMMISDIGSLWRVDWRAVRDGLVEE